MYKMNSVPTERLENHCGGCIIICSTYKITYRQFNMINSSIDKHMSIDLQTHVCTSFLIYLFHPHLTAHFVY